MLARRQLRLIFAFALVIIAALAWNAFDNSQQNKSKLAVIDQSDIDFFIMDASFKSFDLAGNLVQTATATKIEHFKQKQQSLLQQPLLNTFDNRQLSMNISSNSAIADDRDKTITFNQSVLATGFKQDSADAYLKTQVLSYNRHKNSISTDEDIEFTDVLGNITTATGLFSDLTLSNINFKTNFKGTFNAK